MRLFDRDNLARDVRWLIAMLLVLGLFGAWYAAEVWREQRPPAGSSGVGLAMGTIAGLIILFEFLLWPRKALRRWRLLGPARWWMRAHIWLGFLAIPLALGHSGLTFGGWLSTALAIVFSIVVLSGIFGLVVQARLARQLRSRFSTEFVVPQIDERVRQICEFAEDLIASACGDRGPEPLTLEAASAPAPSPKPTTAEQTVGARRTPRAYHAQIIVEAVGVEDVPPRDELRAQFRATILPYLKRGHDVAGFLQDATSAQAYFRELEATVDQAARPVIATLLQCCDERRKLDEQAGVHAWLHSWLIIHLGFSGLLITLLAVHAFVAIKYW